MKEVKEETKKVVKEEWSVQPVPTNFDAGIVKGTVVLDMPQALALALNKLEAIEKILGNA